MKQDEISCLNTDLAYTTTPVTKVEFRSKNRPKRPHTKTYSLRAAINAECKECIYDSMPGNGTWRQQVEACTSYRCPPVSGQAGIHRTQATVLTTGKNPSCKQMLTKFM